MNSANAARVGADKQTQTTRRLTQAISVGSLVVLRTTDGSGVSGVSGGLGGLGGLGGFVYLPAVVCKISAHGGTAGDVEEDGGGGGGGDCDVTLGVLDNGNHVSSTVVDQSDVVPLDIAVMDDLVAWPRAVQAASDREVNSSLVSKLLLSACARYPAAMAELVKIARRLVVAATSVAGSFVGSVAGSGARSGAAKVANAAAAAVLATGVASITTVASASITTVASASIATVAPVEDSACVITGAVLRALRDGLPPDDEYNQCKYLEHQVAQLIAGCASASHVLRMAAIVQQAVHVDSFRKNMAEATTVDARLSTMASMLDLQQRQLDACGAASPDAALVTCVAVIIDPGLMEVSAGIEATRVAYTPHLLPIAAAVVEHFSGSGVNAFTVADIGAGCGAMRAALYRAVCGTGAAVCATGEPRMEFTYRASNARGDYDRDLPTVTADVEVLADASKFVQASLDMIEPKPGDPVRTMQTGRGFTFVRWMRNGDWAVVCDHCTGAEHDKQYKVRRDNLVFHTVIFVAWAPRWEEVEDDCGNALPSANFLPQLLNSLASLQRPVAGLKLLVAGEGHGGCTGDGDPSVHRVLSKTESLSESAFSAKWRPQLPGITSKATFYDAGDVLRTMRQQAADNLVELRARLTSMAQATGPRAAEMRAAAQRLLELSPANIEEVLATFAQCGGI